jgi:hypothetical protein
MTDGPNLIPRGTPSPRPRLRSLQQLIPRLKIARVLSMPEDSFGQLVLSVERDPLFRKFLHTDDPRHKLFSYQRYPRTGLTAGFLELRDDASPATGTRTSNRFWMKRGTSLTSATASGGPILKPIFCTPTERDPRKPLPAPAD